MSVKFANNAFGTLNAGINNSATSITLSSGQGARFPTLASGEYFYATLIDTSNNLEVVKCTARSTDVLTITRAQESTTAQAFAIGDRVELRVTAQGLDDAANPYDKDSSSTGSFGLPVGTTAQQPTAADTEGHIRYDSDDNVVYYSDGANWLKISSVIATLSSATGNIYAGASSTLTLAGKGFQSANLVVNFTQSSDSIDEDVTVTPTSDTAATVTVPAAVYNNVTSGNLVSITVTNSDGITSAAVSKAALALPSGGTVTTSGGYRIHTFTSSGTFTNTLSTTADYLVVAGGGGGGSDAGGGGGAGGMLTGSTSISAQSYAVTVGAGGSGGTGGATPSDPANRAGSGGNSSALGVTCVGGGYGGMGQYQERGGGTGSGGSGGGGGGSYPSAGQGGPAGSGTSGQGNNGHAGLYANETGGGGGGKGQAGQSQNGGNGSASSITGSSVTYAGGGGAGGWSSSAYNDGAGGSGGGGAGGGYPGKSVGVGNAGTANTGGGGGGGNQASGGAGGSGVVIIRYQL